MWEKGIDEGMVQQELDKASSEDLHFSDGRIINSMCTGPLPISIKAHMQFIESNLGNSGLYPGSGSLENKVIEQLGQLMNGTDISGHIVNGGTESNIMALWIARNTTGKREVIFPASAHFSFVKACDLLGMKPVSVPLDENFTIDIDKARQAMNQDTAVVVGMAGTTELGLIDPLEELASLIPDGTFFHVDAAFGGFVIPFLKDLGHDMPAFDFQIPEVTSITIDPHKMGMSTMPSGAFLTRNLEDEDNIATSAPYLTLLKQTTLSGTRCSAAVASTYAAMRALGREGYRQKVKDCMDTTYFAADKARELGLELVKEPVMNVLGIHMPEGHVPVDVRSKLKERNWMVSVAVNPQCLRLVIMPHVKKENIEILFHELKGVLAL
ncbi:MAG: tyrosine decarboxylase MfnA [Thermoplasmata archaeon]|nr:tyrosine decarboxylase MfnA [Thermoplasmata archaeon]